MSSILQKCLSPPRYSRAKLYLPRSLLRSAAIRRQNCWPGALNVSFTQSIRFKHGAKRGQHLETLEELAHKVSHEEAVEKRKKKKEKLAARKGKSKEQHETPAAVSHGYDDWEDKEHEEELDDEDLLPDPAVVKKRMQKHIESFQQYLKGVRGGEPSPELFDDVVVMNAYGKGTGSAPLSAVAQVVISSPTLAVATCFDPATTKAVSLAIRDKLELNPQTEEGGVLKIPLPRASMESRHQTVKIVQKRAEQFRQRLRQSRRNALDIVKKGVAGKLEGVSKDDAFRVQQEIQAQAEDILHELNKIAEEKEKSILSV